MMCEAVVLRVDKEGVRVAAWQRVEEREREIESQRVKE